MTVGRVIDISSNNHPTDQPINWAAVKAAGVTTVLVKATEGTNYFNPWYIRDVGGATGMGLDVLAYHFAGTADPRQEAHFFMSKAGKLARILDIETSTNVPWCRAFLGELGLTPSTQMTYGSASTLVTIKAQIPGLMWPAAYGQGYPGWGILWQFTSSALVSGIDGRVDESRWYGTETQYDDLFAIPEPPPIIKENDMIASTPSGNGYWICHPNGAIDARGDAQYLGGANTSELNGQWTGPPSLPAGHSVTGFTAHPSTEGYWIESDGLVYAYGAAAWHGNGS